MAAAVKDRSYQLLEQELSSLLRVRAGEVESLGETRSCQSSEEEGQGLRPAKDGLDGVVIGEGEGVVAVLGVLNECCDYVVCEFGSEGRVCEIL